MTKYQQYLICKGSLGCPGRGHDKTIYHGSAEFPYRCKYCGTLYRNVIVEENVPVPEEKPRRLKPKPCPECGEVDVYQGLCAICETKPDEVEQIRERYGGKIEPVMAIVQYDKDIHALLKKIDWLEFVISRMEIPKKKQEAQCPEKH